MMFCRPTDESQLVFFSQNNHYARVIRHCSNWQGLNYWAWKGLKNPEGGEVSPLGNFSYSRF